jgi:hypothetical protein
MIGQKTQTANAEA